MSESPPHPPVKDLDLLAKQLWALGDVVRLHILDVLPDGPDCATACNVSQVAEAVGLSQPATSHHLRILRQAGLITNRRMCRDMIYWVERDEIAAVCEALRLAGRAPVEESLVT